MIAKIRFKVKGDAEDGEISWGNFEVGGVDI